MLVELCLHGCAFGQDCVTVLLLNVVLSGELKIYVMALNAQFFELIWCLNAWEVDIFYVDVDMDVLASGNISDYVLPIVNKNTLFLLKRNKLLI